jgi:hypothetical protein
VSPSTRKSSSSSDVTVNLGPASSTTLLMLKALAESPVGGVSLNEKRVKLCDGSNPTLPLSLVPVDMQGFSHQ